MAAPAGVSGGIPQDPAQGGAAPVETVSAGVVDAGAEAAPDDTLATALAARDAAEAEPTVGELPEGELAGGELPGGELAGGELAGGEPAEAGAGGPGPGAAEENRDFRPLAVAGIVLVVLALVGVAVGVLDAVTHGFRPKTVVTYRPAAVFGLRPGECINSGANALDVTVLPCSIPHDAEVFATFSLPETSWPGASVAQLDASDGCVNRLSGYLNPQLATADLTQEYVYPNQQAWQAGEHTVVCEVRAVSGQLTGSVRANS